MRKEKIIKILDEIKDFKERTGAKIIDTHIHPHDVMGIVHHSELKNLNIKKDFLKPGPLEILEYGGIEKVGSSIFFSLFSNKVNNMIRESYNSVDEEIIENEMKVSLIDKGVLLSLDPWTPTDLVGKKYKDKSNFHILGSIDIHNINIQKIESTLLSYISLYRITGIKLHPNLQGFKPQPKDNDIEIADKLRKIYEVASNNKLYILFHGGVSNYTEVIHEKYGFYPRNRTNGIIENFCDADGKSELFENYTMPIVIAHLGHYGKIFHNYSILRTIIKSYNNIFFDTSGVSPSFLAKSLSILPSNKIIFGSDAVYNRIAYNLAFLYIAAKETNSDENFEDILINIMGRNFYTKLLR